MSERTILLGAAAWRTQMQPFTRGLTLCLALVVGSALSAPSANATSICSKATHTKYGETRARFGPTLGSVRQDGSMHAVIYRLDKKAPLGWSHSLRIWKKNGETDWRLQLVAVTLMADTNQPFVLQIDRDPKITFSQPHIQSPQSINEYELTSETGKLAEIVDDLTAGNRLTWSYTDESGSAANIDFSLTGLTAALRWLDCPRTTKQSASKRLISDDRKGAHNAPAFVGTWGEDLAQCSVPQEQQGAPMILTEVGYDQHETHCTFKSVNKSGDVWEIVAACSVEGDKAPDAFTLQTSASVLTMTRGKFSAKLQRCK